MVERIFTGVDEGGKLVEQIALVGVIWCVSVLSGAWEAEKLREVQELRAG